MGVTSHETLARRKPVRAERPIRRNRLVDGPDRAPILAELAGLAVHTCSGSNKDRAATMAPLSVSRSGGIRAEPHMARAGGCCRRAARAGRSDERRSNLSELGGCGCKLGPVGPESGPRSFVMHPRSATMGARFRPRLCCRSSLDTIRLVAAVFVCAARNLV